MPDHVGICDVADRHVDRARADRRAQLLGDLRAAPDWGVPDWSTGFGVDFFGLSGVMNSIHRFERNDTPGVLSGGYLTRGGQRLSGNT